MKKKERKKTDILQGMLDLLVLRVLRHGPLNGWDIIQRIGLVSGDVLRVIPGSLYPSLHKLEARGLVESAWGISENNRRAKFYELTSEGRRALRAEVESWTRYVSLIDRVLSAAEQPA